MLSSVLRSKTAVLVNISIMRAFVLMRQMIIGYDELLKRIAYYQAGEKVTLTVLSGDAWEGYQEKTVELELAALAQ